MSNHWREFRVRGKLKYHDVFVILEIHHGGQFVEVGDGRFEYNGGYRKPPVHYWFKYHVKPKYLPIRTNKEAVGMLSDLPKARKVEVYYVGGGDRDVEVCEKEDQMKEFSKVVPHISFMPEIVMVPLKTADVGNDKGKRRELDVEDSEDEEGTEHL
ncbi:hypothetical protein M0R45_030449 [Rubus argutus]|uniref:Uncharacterized protein n=1 Tax=Rubus argutus TaxID=59490 RepID=A0AAW1WBV1_RUBAR